MNIYTWAKYPYFFAVAAYLCIAAPIALAFPDFYERSEYGDDSASEEVESDNTYKGGHRIELAGPLRQHTLHRIRDQDWFELPSQNTAPFYYVIVQPGADLDIVLSLYEVRFSSSTAASESATNEEGAVTPESAEDCPSDDTSSEACATAGETVSPEPKLAKLTSINQGQLGEAETLLVTVDKSDPSIKYFLKVYDAKSMANATTGDTENEVETCRIRVQYTLELSETQPSIAGANPSLNLQMTSASDGSPVADAEVSLSCRSSDTPMTTDNTGSYQQTERPCGERLAKIEARANGFETVTCHFPVQADETSMARDIALPPMGATVDESLSYRNPLETLMPSQTTYVQGETLEVMLPWTDDNLMNQLPTDACVLYYFALAYPDGTIEVVKDVNELVGLEGISPWAGQRGFIALEKATDDMPLGQYTLYLLRTSGYVTDPLAVLTATDKYELTATQFEIVE